MHKKSVSQPNKETMDDALISDSEYLFALCITDGMLEEMTEEQRKSIILTITQMLKKNQPAVKIER